MIHMNKNCRYHHYYINNYTKKAYM